MDTSKRIVTKIEANPLLSRRKNDFKILRVAAYCRVSTDAEEQLNSYEAQIAYYTETIAKNPSWTFAGIYADEGISGTATKKRKDFLRLMRDCEKGKIDMILTKSISRFARNTVDSLSWVRKLRGMGVGVYFEEQAIDSLKAENEMLIGLFSVIAQSESENIGANVRWGIRQSMKSGTYCTNFSCFGYQRGKDGVPVIVPEQADVVRTMFKMYLDGSSVQQIIDHLVSKNIPTYNGKGKWSKHGIENMLRNEKYVGDLLLQKTYIVDTISKKAKKNDGELPKYLISNNHPAIVDRDTFNRVQAEYASRNNRVKRSETTIQAQGRYCSKYALSEVLTCGCCGSYYRRTYKMAHGKEQRVWRCIGRIEHRCTEAIGVHENKLQEAVCRCLSSMMQNSDEVLELCKQNLQYAFTGDQSALDTVALENQIRLIQDDIDMLMMSAEKTTGDPNKYEKEIIKKYEEIGILREQLKSAQAQAIQNNEVASEIENFIKDMESYEKTPITEFNDVMVRRLVDNIRVMPNHKIVVVLRGGMQREEPI